MTIQACRRQAHTLFEADKHHLLQWPQLSQLEDVICFAAYHSMNANFAYQEARSRNELESFPGRLTGNSRIDKAIMLLHIALSMDLPTGRVFGYTSGPRCRSVRGLVH